ncbi:hypothetical protein [Bradyrhizobium zhanjiangense]|uniref:BIG2 domain-containing protein n=1 Tax=Bradyrhizobium zhanjiangense TaxID=1325107 RepID=A0ABY0DFV8_9BRAD|nr:hypothetical protein [Bradyrhizobium zhanjiangense]RXG91594.1 hypothetical protein EAS62_24250 [Bradyrhizobium zhanjiangense]
MVDLQRVEIVFGNTLKIMEVTEEQPRGFSYIRIAFEQFAITVESEHVMYTLPMDHHVSMQVTYTDAKGNPATVDGEVTWASSDASIASVQVDPGDSSICTVWPVGTIGQAQITATADADLGDGVRELITTADVEIVAGEAVAGSIQPLGEPVQNP